MPLFPLVEPYQTHRLKVSNIHELYIEEVGNPDGLPVIFLHGGPGGGLTEDYRQYFDPEVYRVILFDQRGAGKSTPHACLEENTTWHLVQDIETIRQHFGIEKWLVFGGSWGSTLSLAYSQKHPEVVSGLILRGIFLCRKQEINWFYQEGCSKIYPDFWEDFLKPIPDKERHDMLSAYHKRLTSDDESIRLEAAKAWSVWEGSTSKLVPSDGTIDHFGNPHVALAMARIECHYFVNGCFFESDDQLLRNAHKIKHIPTWIVHGRYDVICPPQNAWDLKQHLPDAKLTFVKDSGHSMSESGIIEALIEALEEYKNTAVIMTNT